MIKSIYDNQTDILNSIISLYCPDGIDLDPTYGNGVFYKKIEQPRLKFDIDPQVEDVEIGDSTNLTLDDNSVNSSVFDPPFLTYIKNGRDHGKKSAIMSSRFSGYWTYDELKDHYYNSLVEFRRVLNHKGILIFKCQDIIHNHKMYCTHKNVIDWAEEIGFRLKDLFILYANHRLPFPAKGKQKHARIYHSYFLIFENWKRK